jgi:hypothetical protein
MWTYYSQDRGTPPRNSTTSMQVSVLDNDDLSPKFSQEVYKTQVTEFYPLSVSINTVKCQSTTSRCNFFSYAPFNFCGPWKCYIGPHVCCFLTSIVPFQDPDENNELLFSLLLLAPWPTSVIILNHKRLGVYNCSNINVQVKGKQLLHVFFFPSPVRVFVLWSDLFVYFTLLLYSLVLWLVSDCFPC